MGGWMDRQLCGGETLWDADDLRNNAQDIILLYLSPCPLHLLPPHPIHKFPLCCSSSLPPGCSISGIFQLISNAPPLHMSKPTQSAACSFVSKPASLLAPSMSSFLILYILVTHPQQRISSSSTLPTLTCLVLSFDHCCGLRHSTWLVSLPSYKPVLLNCCHPGHFPNASKLQPFLTVKKKIKRKCAIVNPHHGNFFFFFTRTVSWFNEQAVGFPFPVMITTLTVTFVKSALHTAVRSFEILLYRPSTHLYPYMQTKRYTNLCTFSNDKQHSFILPSSIVSPTGC